MTTPVNPPLLQHVTLRDWFAGQALVPVRGMCDQETAERIARNAYLIADCMLKARGLSDAPERT